MALKNYATETVTCVNRYAGDYCRVGGYRFHYAVYRIPGKDEVYVTANWVDNSTTRSIRDLIWIHVGEYFYYLLPQDGWDDPVAIIPLTADMPILTICSRMAAYDLYYPPTNHQPIPLSIDVPAVLPSAAISSPLYANYSHPLTWTIQPGDNRIGWGTGVSLVTRTLENPDTVEIEETDFVETAVFANTKKTEYTMVTDGTLLGKEAYLALEYRTYAPDWDGVDIEQFVTLNRTFTPVQLVTRDAAIPLSPAALTTSVPLEGGRLTVRWQPPEDLLCEIVGYILERETVSGGISSGFVQLYRGSSLLFRDTLPEKTDGIRYRVSAVNALGNLSVWADTGLLAVAKSNLYVGFGGTWRPVGAVWVGNTKASPMAVVGQG